MLKTRVIPVLLLKNWNLVKTTQFSTTRTIGNPVQHIKVFNSRNVDELVLLDIAAAAARSSLQLDIISDLSKDCFMPLSVGGGIGSAEDIRNALLAGADKTVINTAAFENPDFITNGARMFGSQCMVVGIDAKKHSDGYHVYVHGGTRDTGINPVDWAKQAEHTGAGEILLTSIDRDGMMAGYDISLVQAVSRAVSIPVIACGGAGSLQDFVDALADGEASAVAAASIFLYTQVTPATVKQYMYDNKIETRI